MIYFKLRRILVFSGDIFSLLNIYNKYIDDIEIRGPGKSPREIRKKWFMSAEAVFHAPGFIEFRRRRGNRLLFRVSSNGWA